MADGDTVQDLKTELHVALGRPASETQAGYDALDFKLVVGAVSIPQRGDSYEDVSEPTLADGRNEHFNGVADGGSLDIPIKWIEGDEGRELMKTNEGSNNTLSFMEIAPDGEVTYWYGRMGGMMRRETTTSSMKGNIAQVRVNSKRLVVAGGE